MDIRAWAEGRYCDNKTIESEVTDGKYLKFIKAEGERERDLVPEVKLHENIYPSPSDTTESEVVSFSALLPCLYSLGSRG